MKLKSYIAGIVTGILLFAGFTLAEPVFEQIFVIKNASSIVLNGQTLTADSFEYEDRTYIQLRNASEIFGMPIDYDYDTATVYLGRRPTLSGAEPTDVPIASATPAASTFIPDDDTRVVATVNGVELTVQELMSTIFMSPNAAKYTSVFPVPDDMKEEALQEAIGLIAMQQHAKAQGFVAEEDGLARADEMLDELRGHYGPDLEKMLAEYKLTIDIYRKLVERTAYVYEYRSVESEKMVTDSEIESYFNEHKDDYTTGEVTAKHILIGFHDKENNPRDDATAKALADELYDRIKKGEAFDKLMEEYSTDPGSQANPQGYTFGRGEMVAEFETMAFSQAEGEVSLPVRTVYGYHIIKTVKKDVQSGDLATNREAVRMALLNQKSEALTKEVLDSATVEINRELIKDIIVQ